MGHRQTLQSSSLWQRWLEQAPNLEMENLRKGSSKKPSQGGPSGGLSEGPSRGGSSGRPRPRVPSGETPRGSTSGGAGAKSEKKKGGSKPQKGADERKGGLGKDCSQTSGSGSSTRESALPTNASGKKSIGGVRSPGDGLTMEKKKVK